MKLALSINGNSFNAEAEDAEIPDAMAALALWMDAQHHEQQHAINEIVTQWRAQSDRLKSVVEKVDAITRPTT